MDKLWRSGIILSAAGFVAGLGNYAFQSIIGHQLELSEYGYVNSTLGFTGLLGLPLLIVSTALAHHIAHYRAKNDPSRLQGLLSGYSRFLFRSTLVASVVALALVKPLSDFFNFPRASLMFVALLCVLTGLWANFGGALCQGMAWFKRMALINLAAVALRLLYGWLVTRQFPAAEYAVSATAVSMLAYLVLLFWRKSLVVHHEETSPWDREFVKYLVLTAACMGGGYLFSQGDLLVAQRWFSGKQLGSYSAAGLLARALVFVVAPLLTVLFTSRSGDQSAPALREQLQVLGLYAGGLAVGGAVLLLMRPLLVKFIFGHAAAEASAMLVPFTITMFFLGLVQALGMWVLASRGFVLGLTYGGLGVAYWLTLLMFGRSPDVLLRFMVIASGVVLLVLGSAWFIQVRSATVRRNQV